jgi:uncharacterized membrane protein
MKPAAILGIVLIILGALALTYKSFSYKERESHDLGPIDVTTTQKKSVPISPILGGIAVVAGIALVFAGARSRNS